MNKDHKNQINNQPKRVRVLLVGPSQSGKTTFAFQLTQNILSTSHISTFAMANYRYEYMSPVYQRIYCGLTEITGDNHLRQPKSETAYIESSDMIVYFFNPEHKDDLGEVFEWNRNLQTFLNESKEKFRSQFIVVTNRNKILFNETSFAKLKELKCEIKNVELGSFQQVNEIFREMVERHILSSEMNQSIKNSKDLEIFYKPKPWYKKLCCCFGC